MHKYLLLKQLALLRGQSVGLRNQGDDVDFVVEPLHELDVQRLQPAGAKMRADNKLQPASSCCIYRKLEDGRC